MNNWGLEAASSHSEWGPVMFWLPAVQPLIYCLSWWHCWILTACSCFWHRIWRLQIPSCPPCLRSVCRPGKAVGCECCSCIFHRFYGSDVGTSSVPEAEFWVSMRGKSETVAAAACSFCVWLAAGYLPGPRESWLALPSNYRKVTNCSFINHISNAT